MSGIAEILHNWGFTVTGSDLNKTDITDKLNDNGILVSIGHDLKNVHNSDLVVYTAAVKQNNPELCEAKNLKIPTIERGDFLGIITKSYLNSIGISFILVFSNIPFADTTLFPISKFSGNDVIPEFANIFVTSVTFSPITSPGFICFI